MKKRILSLVLAVALIAGIVYPALQIGAKAVNDKVMLSATAADDITIQKADSLPEESDFNGTLSLSSGNFKIERDYAQKATVTVTNTGEGNIEYYLVAKNIYKDIYMNFVRNGSTASPLVIQPGETQTVQLDIFAQNAEQGSYTIPVYAMVISGESEIEDAKSTMTLTCDIAELKMTCNEISSNKSTLAKTLRLTNRGGTLTDVTLSFEGDLADYVQLNPIVSNYQMNSGSSVEVKAIPDLTKMKNNNISVISGKLVASSGGQKSTFELTFDTKGEEITSTTMGQLALKQSGNPYYNILTVPGTENAELSFDEDKLDFTASSKFTYGENNKEMGLTYKINGQAYYGDPNTFKPTTKILKCDENGFAVSTTILLTREELLNIIDTALEEQASVLGTQATDDLKEYREIAATSALNYSFDCALYADTELGLISQTSSNVVSGTLASISIAGDMVDGYTYISDPTKSTQEKILYGTLTVGTIVLSVAAVALSGPAAGFILGFTSFGLNVMKQMMKDYPFNSAITLDIEGHQCTNAGAIRNDFYINDYTDKTKPKVKVTGVTVSPSSLKINAGESASLSATVRPENATNKAVRWESEDPEIASVSGGVVRGLKKGVTIIRAITVDGSYRDSCVVTVKVPVKGVTVEPSDLSMMIGDTYSLKANVTPANASNKGVTWSSSNTDVIEVDGNGTITAKATGDAVVTVKTSDGDYTDSSSISVYQPELNIVISPENLSIPKDGTGKLSVSIDSETETIASIEFASLNETIASVDADGDVYGVALGTSTVKVIVKTQRGGTYTATKAVTVHIPVNGVTIINNDQDLKVGDKTKMLALVGPTGAGNQNITWSSDNEAVVAIDADGVITAVSEGTATITVTTEESGFTDSITCTVTEIEDVVAADYVYVTSRMYGGDGVNSWYGSDDPDYVDIQPTTYNYTINGVAVGSSYNSGVTDVAIAKLPADNIRYGAVNSIVCDYTTNPGHYFVNTDTQITMIYPADTPISYIGTPEDLQDVRSLPDFAIYSENIYSSDSSVLIGNTASVSMNIYNRGSMGGWFNIEVTDGDNILYSEENKYLDIFAGETITFDWIPNKELTEITVSLINVNEGLVDESNTENNTATRTFKARQRVVPAIDSITPEYATEGEGIVFATVSNYADVIKTEFYIDNILYTGDVKSSVVDGKMRYWINDPTMAEGERTIKVVVTYATGNTTTSTIESSAKITVLDADWKKYEFVLDSSFSSPTYYIYNTKTNSYSRTYDVSRSGKNCVLTLTKDMYDNPADYILFVSCYNGFVYKNLSDKTAELTYENCNTLNFVGGENIYFSSINYKSFDGNAINIWGGYNSSVNVTPAKYSVEVHFTSFGESKVANLEIDLTTGDKTIDLSSLVSKYIFEFADEINGYPSAKMFYRYSSTGNWNSFSLNQSFSDSKLTCVVPDYNSDLFNNAAEAFILVTTNDAAFVTEVKPASNIPEVITLDKSKLQKYSLDAGDEEISEVRVICDKFSISLYRTTVYLQPGEYDITIVFGSENVDTAGLLYSQAAESDTVNLSIDWSEAYLETGAYVYATGENTAGFTKDDYEAGTDIQVEKDKYTVKTNIARNNSYYIIESKADASSEDAEISIGNSFEGKISNTFGILDSGSSVRIYLDDIADENGNTLTYFDSKDENDNLVGFLTFTDVENSNNSYSIFVSLDNVYSFDVTLPTLEGTYSLELEVMTENEVIRNVDKVELDVSEITLSCNETYSLTAKVYPENATNSDVIWYSDNTNLVNVDENGNVTASKFAEGTATVTVMSKDSGDSASCTVTVKFKWWQKILRFLLISPVYEIVMNLIY